MTPTSEPVSRVFISYAHKDGAALAQRLQADLTKTGFVAWLDTQRLFGGDIWSSEIEQAIDDAEIVIALLSHGLFQFIWRRSSGWTSPRRNRMIKTA